MRTVERILLEARKLSPEDRRELLEKLQDNLDPTAPSALTPIERQAIAYFTEQPRWTPAARQPSVVELLRADRDR